MTMELVNSVTYSFYAVAVITTIAFIYSLYLIFKISPTRMKTYKYYLLNIQIAAYVETIYYTVFLSTIWMPPHFGVNAEGLLCKVFKIPTKYLFGVHTVLYCCVTNALTAAYFYRYQILLFDTAIKISNRVLTIIIAGTYIMSVAISLPLATLAFKDHDESVAEVRKIDTTVLLDDSFILLGGPTFLLWIYSATALAVISFVIFVVIIKHTSIILKNQARFSEMSRKMHQSAMSGLVVQTTAIAMTVCVPVFMMCVSIYLGPTTVTSTNAYVWIGSVLFSMKAFNGTVAMIAMTTSYRVHFMKITGLYRIWPKIEPTVPARRTVMTSSIAPVVKL